MLFEPTGFPAWLLLGSAVSAAGPVGISLINTDPALADFDERVTNLQATLTGSTDIAMRNVLDSDTLNIPSTLGITAVAWQMNGLAETIRF
ncbi:hypothetical protein [uncultured Roseobacter sp.]|uniref:hypothetical protein n=1 Tax=uncultured Roseobacter sp. TaxID=114847 RepID=UPI002603439C|nr:hypothetical protein [uncultured Roseobacter sp.]